MTSKPVPFLDLSAIHAEIQPEIDSAIRAVVETSQFVGGRSVEQFEGEWASYCGTRHAVGVSDGTAALEVSLRALDIGPGAEVIVPTNTFIATWEAVVAVGATPVPVDVDPRTLLMTAEAVDRVCTSKTAAVIVVHLFGQPVDMDAMQAVVERRGVTLIEDAAQAHGATWKGRPVGSFGTAGCFSFYPGKNLGGLGDGGAVVTNDQQLADKIRSLSNHGRSATDGQSHTAIGNNRRLDGLQAAVLSAKLPHLERWNQRRRQIAAAYHSAIADLPVRPVASAPEAVGAHHLAVIEVDSRDTIRSILADQGIGTGIHYAVPCHRQPAFAAYRFGSYPVSEKAATRILSLPIGPHMEVADVDTVATALRTALTLTRTRRSAERVLEPTAARAGGAVNAAFVPSAGGSAR